MNHLIPALILTIAATAATPAAGEKNIGLLIEWIQIDHEAANQLIHQFADQDNATALREELETRLDADKATLLETSYLVTTPGMRAKVDSLLEHIYPTEYSPPALVSHPPQRNFELRKPGEISPGILDIGPNPTAYDTRDLGTTISERLGRCLAHLCARVRR